MKQKIWIVALAAALIAAAIPIGVTVARYADEKSNREGYISSDPFYFTVDLLRDDTATDASWELYGGDTKEIPFTVQNYMDALRVNSTETAFTVTMSYTGFSESAKPTLTYGDGSALAENGVKELDGGEKQEYLLTMPHGYTNNAELTVTVTSSAPYEKEMTLRFFLHTFEAPVTWRIEDTSGSAIVSVFVSANEMALAPGKLRLDWSSVVGTSPSDTETAVFWQIDLTNRYLLEDLTVPAANRPSEGADNTRKDETSGVLYLISAVNTLEIGMGETVEFRFFKSNKLDDYSVLFKSKGGATLTDGVYVIKIQ